MRTPSASKSGSSRKSEGKTRDNQRDNRGQKRGAQRTERQKENRYDSQQKSRGRDVEPREPRSGQNQSSSSKGKTHWSKISGKGKGGGGNKAGSGKTYLYGVHALEAGLLNPARKIHKVYTTPRAADRLEVALSKANILPIDVTPQELDSMLGDPNLVHQGAAAEVVEVPFISEDKLLDCQKIMVLDQITDPHNVGAIMRSAAAFGVDAMVMTKHHSPPITGIVSKTACGGVDLLSIHMASNLARCLKTLHKAGFAIYGLDSEAEHRLEDQKFIPNTVLIMGAEDAGLRRLTRENCDMMCTITTGKTNKLASLNVSNAAAVALHTVLVNSED